MFGPTGNENYTKKLPVSAKRVALRQALSLANGAGKIIVINKLSSKDGKTGDMATLLKRIGVTRDALVVVSDKTTELTRATANLPYVMLVNAQYLNVFDILNAHHLVITADALTDIEQWLKPVPATVKEAK